MALKNLEHHIATSHSTTPRIEQHELFVYHKVKIAEGCDIPLCSVRVLGWHMMLAAAGLIATDKIAVFFGRALKKCRTKTADLCKAADAFVVV